VTVSQLLGFRNGRLSGIDFLLPASRQDRLEKNNMKRRRYQYGCLTKKNNKVTEDVWQFRFYETTPEGRRYRRSTSVGTVAQYPTKTDAQRVIEPLRLRLNLHHRFGRPVSVSALVDRYIEHELPERRHSTQQSHLSALNRWIRTRWGDYLLEQVKPVAVEEWLRSLALAPKTKVNLRSLFHLIYEHARRWELTDRNPIDLVRQRGGRRSIPRVLTPGEIKLLLAQLVEPYHTMVLVTACLGLRASEIMGLQWGDFNWEDLTVLIRRGVVNGTAGDTKTEASRKALPVDPRLAAPLAELWKRSSLKGPQDWVFANRAGRPRGQQNILQRHLRPAALRAGIGKIGWHTFRHSYSTMLRAAGADIKVQQELLRHSTIQSTMNIYTQAVSEQKRAANSVVVGILLNEIAPENQAPANGN
jgi:integrase